VHLLVQNMTVFLDQRS